MKYIASLVLPKNVEIALEIWLTSATIHNNYTPLSDRKLVDELEKKGVVAKKTTIERWRKKYNFADKLNSLTAQALSTDKDIRDLVTKSSNSAVVQKTIDDMRKNEELEDLAYGILKAKLLTLQNKHEHGGAITNDEAKIAVQIALLTSGRKDKALDREAAMATAKMLSSQDALQALIGSEIDIEPIDNDDIDIEIDE